jgi:hypothetical protein
MYRRNDKQHRKQEQPTVEIEWGMVKFNNKIFRTATLNLYDYNKNKDIKAKVGGTSLHKALMKEINKTESTLVDRAIKIYEDINYWIPEDKLSPDVNSLEIKSVVERLL